MHVVCGEGVCARCGGESDITGAALAIVTGACAGVRELLEPPVDVCYGGPGAVHRVSVIRCMFWCVVSRHGCWCPRVALLLAVVRPRCEE